MARSVFMLAWVIVADRQEGLEVSELWSLVAVNAGCWERRLL